MSQQPAGLKHAFLLSATEQASLNWQQIQAAPSTMPAWLHFDYTDPDSREWIINQSGLDPLVADALLSEETRPRTTAIGDGVLLALRGVNLNPGSDPHDMVSIRLWADQNRIISTGRRDLHSVKEIVKNFQLNQGPTTPSEFLIQLCDQLVWRMSDTVDHLEDRIDELEESVVDSHQAELRYQLANLRRQTITLRRYLSPQREAMNRLTLEKISWLNDSQRIELREVSDRLIRHIEDIDAVRERANVTQEELISRMSEQLNERMYVLSIVAAIFLPLGFLTGLLGINVGGIPGADSPQAFWFVSGAMLFAVILQLLVFRWKRWL